MRLIIRDQLALMQHNYLIYGIRNFLDIVIHHNDRFAQPVQLPHQTEYFIPSNWIIGWKFGTHISPHSFYMSLHQAYQSYIEYPLFRQYTTNRNIQNHC